MCVFISSTNFDCNISHSNIIQRDIIINVYRSSRKVPTFPVMLQLNLNSVDIFLKNTEISNFMKIRPVGAELFHANGRTDMAKLTVTFRNFANASIMIRNGEFLTICKAGNVTSYEVLSRQSFSPVLNFFLSCSNQWLFSVVLKG